MEIFHSKKKFSINYVHFHGHSHSHYSKQDYQNTADSYLPKHSHTEVTPRLNVPYFISRGSPVRVSQRPHLLSATRYLELPLENPLLCLRSVCTNSSFERFIICTRTTRKCKSFSMPSTNHRVHSSSYIDQNEN